jgi:penicillin amidase
VAIGRSKNISWGQTTPVSDSSDLWLETINDDMTEYLVDGTWRKLII